MGGLRIGIVGLGFIAKFHMDGYSEAKGVELAACCDLRKDRGKEFQEKWGFRQFYTDYRKMLAEADLDVLSVCTPNRVHLAPTIDALKRGIHVLCEKPIGVNAAEARRMVKAAERSKGLLTVGHNLRFQAPNRALKRIIDSGRLGKIYFGRSHTLRRVGVPGWGDFHRKHISAGGPLIDIGVHGLDLILWFMGFPGVESVSGATYAHFGNSKEQLHAWDGKLDPKEFTVEDFACGMVRLKNGATLLVETSWAGHIEKNTFQQLVLGDRGGAQAYPEKVFTTFEGEHVDLTLPELEEVDSYREEIHHFLACVRGKADPLVRAEESLQTMQVIDGLYRSSETGREVRVRGSQPVDYSTKRKR